MFLKTFGLMAKQILRDAPNEGGAGGASGDAGDTGSADSAAVDKAAADAKAAADKAAEEAKSGDPEKVKLAAEKAELLKEVMDKKTKLKDAQAAEAAAKKALEAYGGVDPEKVKALLKREADAEKAALEAKGDFDRLKQMMADEHAKETKSLKDAIEAHKAEKAELRAKLDEATVGNTFANSNFIREELILSPAKTRALFGAHFEMVDGQLVGFDKPAGASNRTQLVDSAGNPLAFEEALKRIVEADPDKSSIKRGRMRPGSSSKPSNDDKADDGKQDKNGENSNLYGQSRIRQALASWKD